MKPDFARAMREAGQLVRAGRLAEATTALQAALGGQAGASPSDEVIDIDARVVGDAPAPGGPSTSPPLPAPPSARSSQGAPRGAASWLPGRFSNRAGTRDYKLFLPPDLGTGARPLVVMLHGCTQDPDDFARGTRMNELAGAQGAMVLYPAQSKQANPQGCWNWFKHNHQGRDRGEPALLAGMVGEVMRRHDVDPARVYVAGLSAGGAMAAILGDTFADLFAAVGIHSGLAAGAARDLPSALAAMRSGGPAARASAGAPPTIVFHGDADATVHAVNGDRVVQAAGAGGRAVETDGRTSGRAWTRRRFDDGRVEQWVLHGAGHAWSGGSRAGSYADDAGPDASAEMLRFFLAHPKP